MKPMTLSQGRGYLAIPGPSVIPDAVLQAMHQAAPNIYEGPLIDLTKSIVEDLKWAACSTQHVAIYIANGHGAWEAALANIAEPGDKVWWRQRAVSGMVGPRWRAAWELA
jgi:alanine-glyoxylate transaminase/serine-glyoxylate transaminase/serine-pyruvate transaminase